MAEKKKTADNATVEPAKVDVEAFIQRKMKAINDMQDKATARYLADRIISNRKEK